MICCIKRFFKFSNSPLQLLNALLVFRHDRPSSATKKSLPKRRTGPLLHSGTLNAGAIMTCTLGSLRSRSRIEAHRFAIIIEVCRQISLTCRRTYQEKCIHGCFRCPELPPGRNTCFATNASFREECLPLRLSCPLRYAAKHSDTRIPQLAEIVGEKKTIRTLLSCERSADEIDQLHDHLFCNRSLPSSDPNFEPRPCFDILENCLSEIDVLGGN